MGGWLAKANVDAKVSPGAVSVKDLLNIAPGAFKDMIASGAIQGIVDIKDLIATGAFSDMLNLRVQDLVNPGAFADMARADVLVKDLVQSGAIDFGQMISEGAIRGTVRMDANVHDLIQKGAFSSEIKVQDLFPQLKEIVGFKLPLDEVAGHMSKHMTGILLVLAFAVACNACVAMLNSRNVHLLFFLPSGILVYIKYGLALALLMKFFLPVVHTWRNERSRQRRLREHIANEMAITAFSPVPRLQFGSLTKGINVVMMRSCGQHSVRHVCTLKSIQHTPDGGFAIFDGCRPICKSERILNQSPVISVTKEEWDGPSSLVRPVTRMLIYGGTGAGKTSILRGLGVALPEGAITRAPEGTTKNVDSWFHTIGGHLFEFVDVPGAGDGDVRPPEVMRDLANMYMESSFQGVILVLKMTDTRLGTDNELVARLLGLALGDSRDSWLQHVYFVVTHMDCVTSKEAELDRIQTKMVPALSKLLKLEGKDGKVQNENIVPVGLNNYFGLETVLLKAARNLTALHYKHLSFGDMIDVYSVVNGVDAREQFWKDNRANLQESLRKKVKEIMATSSTAPRSVLPSHVQSLLAEAEELDIRDEFQDLVQKVADWEKRVPKCLTSIEIMVDQSDFDAAFELVEAEVQQLPFDARLEVALAQARVKQMEWRCGKIKGEVAADMRRQLHEQQNKARNDMDAAQALHKAGLDDLNKKLRDQKHENEQKQEQKMKEERAKHEDDINKIRKDFERNQQKNNDEMERLQEELQEEKLGALMLKVRMKGGCRHQ